MDFKFKAKHIFTIFLLSFSSFLAQAQIISGNVNIAIPCCSNLPSTVYADSLDMDNDTQFEFVIQSMYGIDNLYYTAAGRHNTQLNGALQTTLNASFPMASFGSAPLMPSTPMGPAWTGWLPNTGFRYMGFRRIDAPNDTTYAWAKLDFRGAANGPSDTVFILEYAYNTVPNVPLRAGETNATLRPDPFSDRMLQVSPNPFSTELNVANNFDADATLSLTDVYGHQLQRTTLGKRSNSVLHLPDLEHGMYFLTIDVGGAHKTCKVIKE